MLDVIGSESANDDETVLDIRSTDAPLQAPPGEDFHDTTCRASPVRIQVLSVLWANGVPRIRLEHRSRMGALCRVGKIEAMDPWPFLWVISETSEMVHGKGNVEIGVSESVCF